MNLKHLKFYNGSASDLSNALFIIDQKRNNNEEEVITSRAFIEALLFILHHCGDYEIQNNVINLLLEQVEVQQFKDWFACCWFCSKESQQLFLQLPVDACRVDVRRFLLSFNRMEMMPSCVFSVSCIIAFWNSNYILSPPEMGEKLWLDFNVGSRTLTMCVREYPPEYKNDCSDPLISSRTYIELKGKSVSQAVIFPVNLTFGTNYHELVIKSTKGYLTAIIFMDMTGTDESSDWAYLCEIWPYIFKAPLEDSNNAIITPFQDGNPNDIPQICGNETALQGTVSGLDTQDTGRTCL